MMRAARLREAGGLESIEIEEIPRAKPADGEAVVRIAAAAFNRRDVFITQGLYPNITLPVTLGSDGAGVVASVAAGSGQWSVGDAVVINPMLDWGDDPLVWGPRASILGMPHDGTFAEYVSVPVANLYPKPQGLSMEEAAAVPLAGLTAYRALFTRGSLKEGETVLLPGIGGGVQTFALIFAKAAGARTIVTSGSEAKLSQARAFGADYALNYNAMPDWHKEIRRIAPVDLVVDSSGGDTLNKAIGTVRPGGRIVVYGGTRSESTFRLFPLFWNHIDIRGTSMGTPQDFAEMLRLFERGLKPAIDGVYRLDEVVAAATRMASGDQFGKIVLRIG
ncbi:MAG: zinc-binding dehydrogenase [Candidatus Eremiobacteraeota bacterium]|nr:zinc-binding dehydrogenase [Candidatus Eremiobacteraeota bacterium]